MCQGHINSFKTAVKFLGRMSSNGMGSKEISSEIDAVIDSTWLCHTAECRYQERMELVRQMLAQTDVMSLTSWNYLNHQILSDQSDKRGKPSLQGMFFNN